MDYHRCFAGHIILRDASNERSAHRLAEPRRSLHRVLPGLVRAHRRRAAGAPFLPPRDDYLPVHHGLQLGRHPSGLRHRQHRCEHHAVDCADSDGYDSLLGLLHAGHLRSSRQVHKLQGRPHRVLRGNTRRHQRVCENCQLHLPAVRQHLCRRGAAGSDGVPVPAHRHHPIPGAGAVRGGNPGVHLRHAHSGFAVMATTAHGGEEHH
ncbi:hypothetical protein GBAR_LOCUS5690 [Geodia barretti]|uniref:Uncharacterized protein n=1 Tax=Geodia barretti TaxID=519541 RepID=A0AA35RBC1_GEOBA|nr:hypothetical protein GBAR_LOCUS5690 [Geodia barretti]